MNAERLHAIVISLNKELNDKRIVALMETMTTTLRAVVQSTNQSTQQNFAGARDALYSALTNTDSDKFSPTWRQILREIGGEDLFGRELKQTIESTLEKNQLTPAIALQDFEALYARLQQFRDALTQTISGFAYFKIGSEKLAGGECEIGILIPRAYVKNQLPEFLEELEHEEFILNTFSEVATGKPDKLEIKALASSEFMVFIQASIHYAAVVAVAVERIVALYKKLLEIRKLRSDMEKHELPEDVVSGVETHANKLMKEGIEKASVEIVNQFYIGEDVGRKNELVVKVRLSMNMLANRIDHGVNVEVRVEPPAATDPKAKDETVQKAVAAIQVATPNMQFLKLEGPPLLQLPENADSIEKPEKPEKTTRPPRKITLEDKK